MTDTWTWATVTQATPLRIKVDGDTSALDATTDNLVGSLAVDDRVRVHLHSDGIIVTGVQGGAPVSYVSVRDYGVTSDGTTDDTTNFQTAWDAAATAGLPLILEPNTTVMVDAITIPDGGRLNLNGATIKKTAATGTAMLTGTGVSNIEIWGGTLDGDKASYATVTEHRHGIDVRSCSDVYIHDLTTIRHKGDGVYVGALGAAGCSQVRMERVVCSENHRQGMSVTAVDGFVATDCLFTLTSGTNPAAGVDIEVNAADIVCTNIRFIACTFSNNDHYGFASIFLFTPTVAQGQVMLVGCTSSGNGTLDDSQTDGLYIRGTNELTVSGGLVTGNKGVGVNIAGPEINRNIRLTNVTISKNGRYGMDVSSPLNGLTVTGCSFLGNSVGNGGSVAGTLDAVGFNSSASNTNITFVGNITDAVNHRYGIKTNANVDSLTLVGNSWAGVTAATVLNDDATQRLALDTEGSEWTAYTPAWAASTTDPALGNGTLTGAWTQIGKTVHWRLRLAAGSTTTFGAGYYQFTLPVAASGLASYGAIGTAVSNSDFIGVVLYLWGGIQIRVMTNAGQVTATNPATFTSASIFTLAGTYEAT